MIFLAEPVDEIQKAKSVPDYESVRACWVEFGQLEGLKLRGQEPREWFGYVEQGGVVYGLEVLGKEWEIEEDFSWSLIIVIDDLKEEERLGLNIF